MTTPLDTSLTIAAALVAAEAAAPSPELAQLHAELDAGLELHGELLGLTADDIDQIRGVTAQARGGQPKQSGTEPTDG